MSRGTALCVEIVTGSLALALLEGCTLPPTVPSDESGTGATYRIMYLTHFSTLRDPEPARVRAVGLHEVYPVASEEFWEACLDVVWQYDAIAILRKSPQMVVFSHGMALPAVNTSPSQGSPRYYNTLIAVLAEPRGTSGTDVYVTWLPPETLRPTRINLLEEAPESLWEEVKKHPHRVTAARVATQFLAHISTQLYWRERWLQKVQARQSSRSTE